MANREVTQNQIIDARYRIIRRIGKGGSSSVYLAKDELVGRRVAMKIFSNESKDSAFIRESRIISRLSHPNIVELYDICSEGKTKYITMEYIDYTLADFIERNKQISVEETVNCATQILKALIIAHSQNIIHLDIKPENILIDRNGHCKLTDFGISKMLDYEKKPLAAKGVGSVYYISPEQAKGEACDVRSDIYSLGVVMYYMITGVLPFDADTPEEVAMKHITDFPKAPGLYRPNIPEKLETVINKAMEKDPKNRYKDAQAMLDDLQGKRKKVQKKQEKRKISIPAIALCAIAAVCIVFLGISIKKATEPHIDNYKMPDLVGTIYSDEIDYGNGITVKSVEYEQSLYYPEGSIIYQSAEAGSYYVDGIEISLKVSRGSGFDESEIYGNYKTAIERIRNRYPQLALNFNCIYVSSDNIAFGDIISYKSDGGYLKNSIIELTVSIGPERKAVMENLLGMTSDEAVKWLEDNEILYEFEFLPASAAEKGKIISQSISAGDTVKCLESAYTVKITVGI